MVDAILWYLIISLLGWLVFPILYRLTPALADRGFALSRTFGWLLWGYLFWLLASLGVLRNDSGGLLFSLLLLVLLTILSFRKIDRGEFSGWLRSQIRLVLVIEALFLASFGLMALVRAANPEILGTEKPMELAFINAILNSPTFPPHDPWLSGYAISYYYFGYVLAAMVAKIAGTSGGVAFNLGITAVFALSAIGIYGIVFDLLAARRKGATLPAQRGDEIGLPLLGPVFLLLVGNLEGFLHVLHTRGLFWRVTAAGEQVSAFWRWLDILDLNQPPVQPYSWIPSGWWWWWRASRVLQDYDFAGKTREIIDEFPAFSYLLADLHPHVLAMPFAFLGMGFVLNLVLGGAEGRLPWTQQRVKNRSLAWIGIGTFLFGFVLAWMGLSGVSLRLSLIGLLGVLAGGSLLIILWQPISQFGLAIFTGDETGERQVGLPVFINSSYFLVCALVLGALGFLNLWDFPFYMGLFAVCYGMVRYLKRRREEGLPEAPSDSVSGGRLGLFLRDVIWVGLILGFVSLLLYLPFYLSFSSQAGGVIPSMVFITRGAHLWVMFGVLLLPITFYLVFLWVDYGSSANLGKGFLIVLTFALVALILSILMAVLIVSLPSVGDIFLGNFAAPNGGALIRETLIRRLRSPGGWITLTTLLTLALALLLPPRKQRKEPDSGWLTPADAYVLLLILFGGLLVFGPEFFYLRDQFGSRMNTIFKFYYQAWLMWAVAAAFGSAVLLKVLSPRKSLMYSIGLILLIGMGMTYTLLGLWNKTAGFSSLAGWTLDGTAYIAQQSPDEISAIDWLSKSPPGVVAEAVGNSYSGYARVATLSGKPTVLGWPGHESQWRGGAREMGSRQVDIQTLYCTANWEQAKAIIQQYNIRYIYVGSLERTTYTPQSCGAGLSEAKFSQNLIRAYHQGDVTIYQTP